MLKVTNGSSQFLPHKVTLNMQVSCLDNNISTYSASVRRHRDGQPADSSNGGRKQHWQIRQLHQNQRQPDFPHHWN